MNIKKFNVFINEGIGAITMNRTPVDKLNNPNHNIAQSRPIPMGGSSHMPAQWGRGPGTAQGSRYGSNPTIKSRAMTYSEFIKNYNTSKESTDDTECSDCDLADDKITNNNGTY